MQLITKPTIATVIIAAASATVTHSAVISFQNGVDGYTGTQDTWIGSSDGSGGGGDLTASNYGSDGTFKVEDDPAQSDGQGLIRFDNIFGNGAGQIALGSTIVSAAISITTQNGGFADVTNAPGIHRMLVNWGDQSTVTWDTFDTSANGDDGGMSSGSDYVASADDDAAFALAKGETGTWDVTASLANWSAGGINNGWAFIGDTNNGWDAYTSEFTTVGSRPLLTVTYEPVPEPTTTALLGLGGLALILRRRK